jgi:cytochrome oxidase assembly protein ShyY1
LPVQIGTTIGLGTWQASRYSWKQEVLATRRAQLDQPPTDITAVGTLTAVGTPRAGITASAASSSSSSSGDTHPSSKPSSQSLPAPGELRRVTVRGVFDSAAEVRVGPRPPGKDTPVNLIPASGSMGYQLLTPLVRPDGSRVLVLRGWAPVSAVGASGAGGAAAPTGTVAVTGVLRAGEDPGKWAVEHAQPEGGHFTWLDTRSIAERAAADGAPLATGTDGQPLLVEAVEPLPAARGVFPITRQLSTFYATHVMPETHIIYAATWYTLAAAGAAIAWYRFRRPPPRGLTGAAGGSARGRR